jgi:uncharacterized damage-inducible protein DinB
MYRRIEDFLSSWEYEASHTSKMIGVLTDAALGQPVAPGHRTLGRVAWHLAQSIPEMMNRTGLPVAGADPEAAVPRSAAAIKEAYDKASASLVKQVKANWNDATLEVEDNMYGETWKRGVTLASLIVHQAHHRGQMTVLMRQAGLKVPGVYGPALEDWAAYGRPAPAV